MSILWCGGEDIDFPNGTAATIDTSAGTFRSGYARCSIRATASAFVKSSVFPGGAITSGWLSARANCQGTQPTNQRLIGFGLSGGNKGLYLGVGTSFTQAVLMKYDGTTNTTLATESGNSLIAGIRRVDVQLVGPLATAVVNVYIDGVLIISYSGDVTVSGLTNYDSIFINGGSSGVSAEFSEIIVADEDPRAWPGLVTLALTGAGTTDAWTGSTFSNINGTTISDASPMSSNTTGQDSQYNVTDLPSGSFLIKAIKIAARMAKSASPAVTQVKLGYNDGGTVAFGTGATKALTTAYATYEQLDTVNPNGGAAFTQSIMNALQLEAQSLT